MNVLFIGSNPSVASGDNSAFNRNTKSFKILQSWVQTINGTFYYLNVSNNKTINNRPLKLSEIQGALNELESSIELIKPDKVIALGKTAAKALTLLRYNFYEMPHPSGRNRLLNDKVYVQEKIKGLLVFVHQ